MMEGGALVVGADSDTIFHIVKPKTVVIPWVDVHIPEEAPHAKAVKQRDGVTGDMIEAMLWSAADFNERTFCKRAQVIEVLEKGLHPQALTSLYAGFDTRALEICQGLGLPILEGTHNGKTHNVILGFAEPVGYNLMPVHDHGQMRGAGTFKEGWMVYPACVAVCEVV